MTERIKRIVFYAVVCLLVGSAACDSSCNPGSNPTGIPNAVEITGSGNHGELTAAVFAGGKGACTNGRVYITSQSPKMLMRKLANPGSGPFDVEMPALKTNQTFSSTDHQMTRLANGDLLLMWQAATREPLSYSPQPDWRQDWGVKTQWDPDTGNSGGVTNVLNFLAAKGARDGYRSTNVLWRFSGENCAWSAVPTSLDSGEVKGKPKAGSEVLGYCAQLAPGLAGFDRFELYADPWGVDPDDSSKQTIYVSTLCGRCVQSPCPALQNKALDDDHVEVFISSDTGVTWKPTMRLSVPQPVAMTSTGLTARLFMFGTKKDGDVNPGARLYWYDRNNPQFASATASAGGPVRPTIQAWVSGHGAYDITYDVPDPNDSQKRIRLLPNWLGGSAVGVNHAGAATLSLARAGINSVLAVYPAVENTGGVKRQVAVVVWVVTNPESSVSNPPWVVPIKIIRAESAQGSVLLPTLIEDDRRDAPSATTMLYWIETKTNPSNSLLTTAMVAKSMFFTNGIFPGDPQYLSDVGGWTSNNGARAWLGDYMKGSFYADGDGLHFVAAWPQIKLTGDPNSPSSQTQAYVRIVTLQPQTVKALPDPKTMPGARPAEFLGDKP